MNRTWNRACEKSLGAAVQLYESTRHYFASLALGRGAEFYRVQRLLGHTDPRTTERCAKLADTGLLSATGAVANVPMPVCLQFLAT